MRYKFYSPAELVCLLAIGFSLLNIGHAQQLQVVTENAPPLQFIKEGKIQGPTTQIVNAMLAHANISADIQMYPWARAYEFAKSNRDTLIYPLIRTPEREQQFTWIGPLLTMKLGFIKLKTADDISITSLDDAKRYKLGVMRGDFTQGYLDRNNFINDRNYELFSSIPELLKLLYAQKIDIFIADLPLLKLTAIVQGYDPSLLVTEFFLPQQQYKLYLAANKEMNINTITRLQTSLNYVTVSDSIDKYSAK